MASMGTAALEGAAIGLPTILLDISYTKVPETYRFRWLHHASGYELGHTITEADCSSRDTLPDLLDQFSKNYRELSLRAFNYVKENHSIRVIASQFKTFTSKSEMRFGNIPSGVWRKSLVRRIYERIRY